MMIYDFPNLLAIVIFAFIAYRVGLIPFWLSFFLGIFSFTPFFLNDVFFPATLFSDQFVYLEATQYSRSFDINSYFPTSIDLTGKIFALFPMPYAETIQSLGFFNRFLATMLIVWLYASKNLRGWPLLFVLFYPSFLLYSSLTLRDTIILFLMVITVILFLEKKTFLGILVSSPLFVLKFQNFFLLIILLLIHLAFSRDSVVFRLRFILLPILVASIIPFLPVIIEVLDFYRYAFHVDDGGDPNIYIPIVTFGDFASTAFAAAPYFMMKPFPWEASGFLQLLQSLENILIASFLIFIFLKTYRIDHSIAMKWAIFLFISFSIYGLVVYNFGTAARYKFPFYIIIVVGLAYELYLKHGRFILNIKNRN